ncbi:MAG: Fis family transcriptional regulator [Deltaproteobacteria bacterium]|nr:MAG: Fis family transcriptional regulator [Deltaproteobacteria bacterium]
MTTQLTADERQFFRLLKETALANPFSDTRRELDMRVAADRFPDLKKYSIDKTVQSVSSRLKALSDSGRFRVDAFASEDRVLVEFGYLFEFFYLFRKQFDHLIKKQALAEDRVLKVLFTAELISYLSQRGFSDEGIQRGIEGAYQFRRAFYFIGRSLIGRSTAMKKLRLALWNTIFTHNVDLYRRYLWNRMEDFSTLILGETGTGKGAAAAAIGRSAFIPFDMRRHRFVESFTRSFVSINLSQFPETLIESELFGHKKGAFTGAVDNYRGVLERCSPHGAILLDEIGEITLPVQIKLLQVLQERVFYPVGSHIKERFHGRVIAATNRSIDQLRKDGIFRDDFYYRLCSDTIVVPPLRQRIAETPRELTDLVGFLVTRTVGRPSPELEQMVLHVIAHQLGPDYPWNGNVRELEQCVRSVIIKNAYTGDSPVLDTDLETLLTTAIARGSMPAQQLLAGYCKLLYDRHGTFEAVARHTCLDRRTVTKYIKEWSPERGPSVPDPETP